MTLYLEAKTSIPDLFIDYIEVRLTSGESASLNWDESEIYRNPDGFGAKYKGVYFGEEPANGRLDELRSMVITDIGLYSDTISEPQITISEMEFVDNGRSLEFSPPKTAFRRTAMLMRNSEHRKELISEIKSLAQSQGLNTVFTTFLEIVANSLAGQTDPENAEKREQRYQEMASTMSPELLSSYARMLALLFLTVREYRDDPCDILGGIYHELNLNNEWNGQHFTPDNVCRLMAQITLPSDELSVKDGPITINEPTCGSGTMVIGAIWAMQQQDFDYRRNTFFVAQDIDIRCVWMTYIQLSLYEIPAMVIHGNTLTMEEWDRWYTPYALVPFSTMRSENRCAVEPANGQH